MVLCATLLCACAAGMDGNGFGSAASIGGGDDGGTAGTLGAMSGGDGKTSVSTLGGMSGGGSDGSSGGGGPTNPNETCNGLDDDGNGQVDDGLGTLHCGMGVCANDVPACENGAPGTCTPLPGSAEVCNGIDDNCDGSVDEGLTTTCSTACGSGTEICAAGVTECDAPQPVAESCNYEDDDCNDAIDDGLTDCRVPVQRSYDSSTGEHFYTTSLSEAQTGNFNVEVMNFFYVYPDSHPGLVAFYRCLKPNGKHFYTQSSSCEGQTVEGILGYVTSGNTPETTALYRLYNASLGDHLYTTSSSEKNDAIASSNYADEGIACYVFTN